MPQTPTTRHHVELHRRPLCRPPAHSLAESALGADSALAGDDWLAPGGVADVFTAALLDAAALVCTQQTFFALVRMATEFTTTPAVEDDSERVQPSAPTTPPAEHSELKDRRIETVLIDSAQLNAFAAPGGIVGVNKGIFLYAQTEHELAGILAHELAHLSQRHFARGVEQGRRNAMVTLAGLLATVVLMSTVGGDAGMAAFMGAQGVAQNEALKYSRSRESEADRVGINTLHRHCI